MELLSTHAASGMILGYGGDVLAETCQVLAEGRCPRGRRKYMLHQPCFSILLMLSKPEPKYDVFHE